MRRERDPQNRLLNWFDQSLENEEIGPCIPLELHFNCLHEVFEVLMDSTSPKSALPLLPEGFGTSVYQKASRLLDTLPWNRYWCSPTLVLSSDPRHEWCTIQHEDRFHSEIYSVVSLVHVPTMKVVITCSSGWCERNWGTTFSLLAQRDSLTGLPLLQVISERWKGNGTKILGLFSAAHEQEISSQISTTTGHVLPIVLVTIIVHFLFGRSGWKPKVKK